MTHPKERERRAVQEERLPLRTSTKLASLGRVALHLALAGPVALTGCESADPVKATDAPGSQLGNTPSAACHPETEVLGTDSVACAVPAGEYTPRSPAADDGWPACIADSNTYVPFQTAIGALGRVAAFEKISEVLGFGSTKVPTPQDFVDARFLYLEREGLESRVARREDDHYPPAPKACRDLTPEEQSAYPERCVGPAKIRPILNSAFQEGHDGIAPQENAARIEAALLWFFYISIYKESTSAAEKAADVDSAWAKYTGGAQRDGAIGLSRYVKTRSQQAHDRIWDGLLAVRCWRDIDNPTGAASQLELQGRARAQLDRALLRGMAVIVRQRLPQISCAPAWESVRILGGVLDREATLRDPAAALVLRTELSQERPELVNVDAATGALDTLFPCP